MKTKIGVIDLTPTWAGVLPMLVEVAANGTSLSGRMAAMGELKRLAQITDRQIAAQNEISKLWESL